MSRLRIAMVGVRGLASALPPRFRVGDQMLAGGAERAAEELARKLVERGHHVTLFTRGGAAAEVLPGLALTPAPFFPGRLTEAITHTVAATIKALRGSFDVVHFHAVGPASCAVLTRAMRVPSVITVQGLDWNRGKWNGWERVIIRQLGVTGIRVADAVTVVAPSLLQPVRDLGGRKVVCVPNGYAALGSGDPRALERWGLQRRRYHLMMTRLVPEKNVEDVVRAYATGRREWPLVIAGGGSYSDGHVQSIQRLIHTTPGVRSIGPVHGGEKATLMTEAGSFLNASSLEGLSLALLEALGAGIPVGVSRIPQNLDIFVLARSERLIEHLSFPVGDLFSLSNVITHLETMTSAERAVWGMLANTIREVFSWDRIAAEMESVYQSAVPS